MALKVKFRTQFPAVVSATNPITINKVGLSYTFSLDQSGLQTSFDTIYGKLAGTLAQFAATTSAQLAGVISDETGSGSLVFATSPTLVTPVLGAASATSLNISGLTGNQVVITDVSKNLTTLPITGTPGSSVVLATSPTLVTPTLGAASATTINKVTITAPATSATLTLIDGTVLTGPSATGTIVTKTSTDTLTNKNFDTAGAGNSFSINSVAVTANTGTGAVVRATSPTLVTPVLGAATATTINGATIDNSAWTSYSPTITSQTGAFTGATIVASGRYKQIGKTIIMQADVTLTALGSGSPAGGLRVSLPFTAAAFNYNGSSRDIVVSGKTGCALVLASGTTLDARAADGTTYIAATAQVIIGVTYEVP